MPLPILRLKGSDLDMPKFSSTYQPIRRKKPISASQIPKMSSKRLKNLDVEQYRELEEPEMRALAKRAYELTSKRVKQIEKKGLESPAYNRYLSGQLEKPSPSDDRSSLMRQFASMKRFLAAKTSTVQGIQKQQKSVSARIFGEESDEIMTSSQSKRFWSAYQEFMHQYPSYLDQSERIQQMIGAMTFWKKRDFNANDIDNMIETLEGKKREFTPYGGTETRSYSFGGNKYGTSTTEELDIEDYI